ncbi:MAG: acetoacetate decarboxylase family protein [Actinomycetota bacterium]|nr:acetoacetate decarboxylase family protein [Actinomycetota bacterium]MDH4352804.1 acetoacetate decarboxylase family protein [Actinomycetota bacterium]
MAALNGFLPPYTESGRSALVPMPPWHYSGDLLTVEYRTDPERVAALLPGGVELSEEDPGAVAMIWADWQSCSDGGEELLDPSRSQYKEAFVVVRCRHAGVTYSRCVLIWVTSDFAIGRGLHQGYPKKLGSIYMTRPMPHGKAAPRVEAGGTFGATLAAYDHRLATARVTLTTPSESNGVVNALPMLHNRQVRAIERDGGLVLDELITMGGYDADVGPAWAADAELELADSPWDELASALPVREITGGFYRQIGVSWNGGTTVERRPV